MAGTRNKRTRAGLPPGAWHVCETVWGEAQRVRLVTGPPSLVESNHRIRSVHAVGFVPNGLTPQILLVQNADGKFTFPGGRLEGIETTDAALIREVWEEARATLVPEYRPVAATRVEFLNRVPGRVYPVHPSFFLWVAGAIASLEDGPVNDPAPNGVVDRKVVSVEEARGLLAPVEVRVLDAALAALESGDVRTA
ncbi:MAG TPA: NUDIX domain-containing protein [Armatimonadaceae bacterium]|nr:NUDIX domain-containing protein [Armatimonadaceae bacterium]